MSFLLNVETSVHATSASVFISHGQVQLSNPVSHVAQLPPFSRLFIFGSQTLCFKEVQINTH